MNRWSLISVRFYINLYFFHFSSYYFYCCSVTAVPIFFHYSPPIYLPPSSHIQPPCCLCLWVLYTYSLTWPFLFCLVLEKYNFVHFIDILVLASFSLIIGIKVSPVLLEIPLKLLTASIYILNDVKKCLEVVAGLLNKSNSSSPLLLSDSHDPKSESTSLQCFISECRSNAHLE